MKNWEDYKNIHLIGIGGASMYAIAAMLKNDGKMITGSDIAESHNVEFLRSLGIKIVIGHDINLVKNADLVIYTAAISDDDIELIEAKKNKIPTMERAPFLGLYTKNYENLICISGTHGKSTTTSMVASIFLEAGLDPTIQIGASLKRINGNYYIGGKKYFILEACEYVDSFLNFNPTSEIILNIDNDHLDYFGTIDNIKKSFKKYTELLPDEGLLVLNNDDINSHYLKESKKNIITYGIKNKSLVEAKNITYTSYGFPSFDVYIKNEFWGNITLKVLGEHNILNALASISLAINYGISKEPIIKALEDFGGVGRRFEYVGKYNGALVFDDFAHHPTEIMATYNSSKAIKHNDTWAIFQAHTYSRTYQHKNEFADILAKFDHVIITDIYPAREINTWGVKEEELVELIHQKNKNVIYIPKFLDIVNYLKNNVKENDLILTIGAGSIFKVAEMLTKEK